MPIKSLFGKTYGVIERALEIGKLRHGVIASNVANVATPAYRSKDLDFSKALDDALEKKSIGMDRTHPLHFQAQSLGSVDPGVIQEESI